MKRSDMVKKLGASLYLELGPRIGDLDTARRLGELLLYQIEELGMLPPPIEFIDPDGQEDVVFEWEKE